jgi:hypothetical protein
MLLCGVRKMWLWRDERCDALGVRSRDRAVPSAFDGHRELQNRLDGDLDIEHQPVVGLTVRT